MNPKCGSQRKHKIAVKDKKVNPFRRSEESHLRLISRVSGLHDGNVTSGCHKVLFAPKLFYERQAVLQMILMSRVQCGMWNMEILRTKMHKNQLKWSYSPRCSLNLFDASFELGNKCPLP